MITHQNPTLTAYDAASLDVTAVRPGADWHTTAILRDSRGQDIQVQEFVTVWPHDRAHLTAAFGVASLQLVTASRADDPTDRVHYRVTPYRRTVHAEI